jgi:hypothetical protein
LGPLSATQQQKLLNYTLNPNFSVKRLQRELGGSNERTSRDHSDYDTMMVRGARIVHKIQERNEAKFAEVPEQRINNEILKDIADGVMKKATQSSIAGRDYQVLQYLSALSDFPDSCFDYKVNEQHVNKMIRDAYKNLSIRQAFTPFILIQGDDLVQNSRKLSQKLMREFSNVYGKGFTEASTHQIVSIMEKFVSHNWMLA